MQRSDCESALAEDPSENSQNEAAQQYTSLNEIILAEIKEETIKAQLMQNSKKSKVNALPNIEYRVYPRTVSVQRRLRLSASLFMLNLLRRISKAGKSCGLGKNQFNHRPDLKEH